MNLIQAGVLIFSLILFSLTCTTCDSRILYAMDGDEVNLDFPYPCNSTYATLQYGNRIPFYNSADPQSLNLYPSELNRISVKDTFKDGICLLQLNISHVKRHDVGTYILYAQNNEYLEKVELRVNFPPGEAQCRPNEISRTGHWMELNCTAPVGSIPGHILCYQDGTLMPWFSKPLEIGTSLKQTILVQQNNHHVFCCSSTMVKPKEICQCKDFVWDPQVNLEINDQIDPCVSQEPVDIQTVPPSYPFDYTIASVPSISETRTTAVYEDANEKVAKISVYAFHIFLFATFPLYVIVNIAHFKGVWHDKYWLKPPAYCCGKLHVNDWT